MCFTLEKIRCEDEYGPGYGDEWLYFVDDNGTTHVMNFTTLPKERSGLIYGKPRFYLHTRDNINEPEELFVNYNSGYINSTYFNESNDIKAITHGWLSHTRLTWVQNIKNKMLETADLNIILVDWGNLARNPLYPWPALSTRYVGRRLAKLLEAIRNSYDVQNNTHLIGHSLGAHVMGYAGMFSKEKVYRITEDSFRTIFGTNIKLKHKRSAEIWWHEMFSPEFSPSCLYNSGISKALFSILGLDPARPLFELPNMGPNFSLDKSDALFVDIIHTCGGSLGYQTSHGHADFYPNQGQSAQPGCEGARVKYTDSCSHGRSYEYFYESIDEKVKFNSYPCDNWERFDKKECKTNATLMGYPAIVHNVGDYFLYTKNESTYAMEDDSW